MSVKHPLRRKRFLFGGLISLLILAAITLPFLPRDNSISNMLPADSGIHQMLDFLQEARFAGQVALSFQRDAGVSDEEFTAAIERFIAQLDTPLVERIIYKIDIQTAGADIAFFQRHLPALTDEQGLSGIAERLNPPAVGRALRRKYLDLLKPGGSLALPLIQRDPLDIQQDLLNRMQALATSSGYNIELKNGYLFSADSLHALVVLETSAPITDMAASRALLTAVETTLRELPEGISADIICGHRHSVSNEAVLKRDVQRAVFAAAIGFLLLFLLCFRDHRAQFIFAIPLASVLFSIHLCRWITGSLSLFVLGFGVVIVGIAVDYGIHVYVAIRSARDSGKALRGVIRPIVLGALTTLGVFAAFFAAGVPGYSQMAVFSITSILLSLLGALYILPHLIKPQTVQKGLPHKKRPTLGLFIPWLLFIILLLSPFPRLSFDSELRALDGAEQVVWDAEDRFHEVWGGGAESLALVVVEAPDYETALGLNDDLYSTLQEQKDSQEFSSFSSVWKSTGHRAKNAARWQAFWTEKRIEELRGSFAEQGAAYGFKPDAFAPFFQTLETSPVQPGEPTDNQIFNNLKTRFTQSLNGAHQVISFFPDTEVWVERVRNALGDSKTLLVSRREIDRVLSTETVRTVKRVATVAVALVILFTALLIRRPKEIVLALLPAVVSVLTVLKILEITGLSVNIPTLISGIVVIGLSIDYGIFMVFGCKRGTLPEVCTAVTLSTLTTLIGAGVLVLTRHPALFSIGVTMVAGLTAGYATALCAVPFLFSNPWKQLRCGSRFFPNLGKRFSESSNPWKNR